jgi:hypothetical protein
MTDDVTMVNAAGPSSQRGNAPQPEASLKPKRQQVNTLLQFVDVQCGVNAHACMSVYVQVNLQAVCHNVS